MKVVNLTKSPLTKEQRRKGFIEPSIIRSVGLAHRMSNDLSLDVKLKTFVTAAVLSKATHAVIEGDAVLIEALSKALEEHSIVPLLEFPKNDMA